MRFCLSGPRRDSGPADRRGATAGRRSGVVTAPDVERLDDADWLSATDPSGMLRAVATSAAQVRSSYTEVTEADLAPVVDAGRPRALVVAGMGGSGIAGEVLAAVAGPRCPTPVIVHRGYGLPGWVGA